MANGRRGSCNNSAFSLRSADSIHLNPFGSSGDLHCLCAHLNANLMPVQFIEIFEFAVNRSSQ